jgi:hypothetical protein
MVMFWNFILQDIHDISFIFRKVKADTISKSWNDKERQLEIC